MKNKESKIIDNKIFLAYGTNVPEEEVKSMEELIKRAIKNAEKPRCNACIPCPMGVIGCDYDDIPHGHATSKRCPECGVLCYRVHPHSKTCSKGTPITDDVRHDENVIKMIKG